jgi:hypothetical protein
MIGALVDQEYQEENAKSKTGECNGAHLFNRNDLNTQSPFSPVSNSITFTLLMF